MSVRSRATVLVVTVAALLAAATLPAQAQEPGQEGTHYLGADATTLELTVLGTPIGAFAGTSAVAEHAPTVTTGSFGFRGADGAATVAATEAVATAVGDAVRDPEGDDLTCDVPSLPAELPVADALALADVCSVSYSAIAGARASEALGAADAGRLTVNGRLLADVVLDIVLGPILDRLEGAAAPLEDAVLAPVDDALAAVCDELPEEVSPAAIVESAEASGLPVGDVIAALPEGEEIAETLGDDCLLSLTTMVDLAGVVLDIVEDEVRSVLTDALDRDLLEVVLGSSASSLTADGTLSTARAEIEALAVSTPSLEFLVEALRDLVGDTVQDGIDQVGEIVPDQLDAAVAAIPSLDDALDQVLAQLPLDGLVDDQPLLQVAAASSVAEATAPIAGGDVDISESAAGALVVRISPAVATLLGVPAETTIAPGERQTVAEGTPLESTLAAGQVEPLAGPVGTADVETAGVRVTASEVALLTGVEGGIVATTGAATARLGGTPAAAPIPALPQTGSNDTGALVGAIALVGVALGGLALRRRMGA